ncbi:membrane protein [Amylibacter ulvae]|uniref:Membrane protein n=2 Tax=Paramylibacter ulvae TaxID=1651968 RepID=A0ABQ3CVS3_9RHOB|nr:membrane protein [Amylibacter ulvae]
MHSDNPILRGAILIVICMLILGVIDNFVKFIAQDVGLWQFQAMKCALIALGTWIAAWRMNIPLRPLRPLNVFVRSALYAVAMLLYFGALGTVPVSIAAAGLFLAPIFVVILSVVLFKSRIGPYRIFAILLGFAGVLVILRPFGQHLDPMAILPVAGALFYALAMMFTGRFCAQEQSMSLLFWYFLTLGTCGVIGMTVIHGFDIGQMGELSFLNRPFAWPTLAVLGWILIQSIGSGYAILLQTRAYQIADASIVSVFEYSLLVFAGFWGWLLWGETLIMWDMIGMAMIAFAGICIAFRNKD